MLLNFMNGFRNLITDLKGFPYFINKIHFLLEKCHSITGDYCISRVVKIIIQGHLL